MVLLGVLLLGSAQHDLNSVLQGHMKFSEIKNAQYSTEAVPEYAKWGNIAVKETQKRYSDASIIDYLHIGRTEISPIMSEEKFKLWLRRLNGKEFGVFISIRFNSATNQILRIRFTETAR